MDKKKLPYLILTLIAVIINFDCYSQGSITYRIAFNSNSFIREPGSSDATPDPNFTNPLTSTRNFTPEFGPGFEAEITFPMGESLSVGFEIERLTLNGYNDDPIYFNYFASTDSPENLGYNFEPLAFNTIMNNLLLNVRYYFLGRNTLQPFIKVSSGVAFVGTGLHFRNIEEGDIDPLYARGTKNSDNTKWPVFTFSGGGGIEFQVTDKILIYLDASISNTQTGIIDGVPNFSYDPDAEGNKNQHFEVTALTTQLSAGLCYSLGEGVKLFNKGGAKQSKGVGKRKGRIHEYFPFYEIKN